MSVITTIDGLERLQNNWIDCFKRKQTHHYSKLQAIKTAQKTPAHILISVFTLGVFAIVKAFIRFYHEVSLNSADKKLASCKLILCIAAEKGLAVSSYVNKKIEGNKDLLKIKAMIIKASSASYSLLWIANLCSKASPKLLNLLENVNSLFKSFFKSESEVDFIKNSKNLVCAIHSATIEAKKYIAVQK
jgi:hypothetical protein